MSVGRHNWEKEQIKSVSTSIPLTTHTLTTPFGSIAIEHDDVPSPDRAVIRVQNNNSLFDDTFANAIFAIEAEFRKDNRKEQGLAATREIAPGGKVHLFTVRNPDLNGDGEPDMTQDTLLTSLKTIVSLALRKAAQKEEKTATGVGAA